MPIFFSFLQPVDFETKRAYSLKIEAANVHIDPKFISNGPFKDTVTVKISVEDADEPPMFLAPSYIHEVQENAAAGTVVGRVHAKDPDAANSPIRYTCMGNFRDGKVRMSLTGTHIVSLQNMPRLNRFQANLRVTR